MPEKLHLSHRSRFVILGGTPDELITLGEMKMRYVRKVLSLSNGNKSLAARILGIDRRTISHRVVEAETAVDATEE